MRRSPLDGCVRGRVAGERDEGRDGRGRSARIASHIDEQGECVDRLHRVPRGQDLGCPNRRLGVGMAQGPGEPVIERLAVIDGQGGAARFAGRCAPRVHGVAGRAEPGWAAHQRAEPARPTVTRGGGTTSSPSTICDIRLLILSDLHANAGALDSIDETVDAIVAREVAIRDVPAVELTLSFLAGRIAVTGAATIALIIPATLAAPAASVTGLARRLVATA